MKRDPAFLAAFHVEGKYYPSQNCLLNIAHCSAIPSFPRDISLPFFPKNFLNHVPLEILNMDLYPKTSSKVQLRLCARESDHSLA